MDFEEIKQLAALLKDSELAEIELEKDGMRLKVVNTRAEMPFAMPVPQPQMIMQASAPANEAPVSVPSNDNLYVIKSPIVGTFYASATQGGTPFVERGCKISANTVVCIVEAMKVMNEIMADVEGEIVEVLLKGGSPVEYGQPLFKVKLG